MGPQERNRPDPSQIVHQGLIASGILLAVLMGMAGLGWLVLTLESRWIVVALVPTAVAVFLASRLGGETAVDPELQEALGRPPTNGGIGAATETTTGVGSGKAALEQLSGMSDGARRATGRLAFQLGERYTPNTVLEHLGGLPNLSFLELRREGGRFFGLLDVGRVFVAGPGEDEAEEAGSRVYRSDAVGRLCRALRHADPPARLRELFGDELLEARVAPGDSVEEMLHRARRAPHETTAVVDPSEHCQGVVSACGLERQLVDQLLQVRDRDRRGR